MTAQPLLEAQELTRHYTVSRGFLRPRAVVRALEGASFTLHAGKTLGVVGESGCGKSTLARQVAMIETPTSGSLRLDGLDLSEPAHRRAARRWVQMVFQNPYASLNPRKKIGAMLDEPLELNTDWPASERRDRAQAMLAQVGLRPEHARRYPHMFSGGQRQRIAIARALMLSPKIVIADEPVSALDVSVQGQILNLLEDLQRDTGVAYLFISHNLAVVEHIADDIAVMYLGRIVEAGTKAGLFSAPAHPYTQALLASTPVLGRPAARKRLALKGELPSPAAPPSGCPFSTRCPHAADRCRAEVPLLRELGAGRQVACHRAEEIAAIVPAAGR
jgi:dipeptide transport system ATP-binding protein